MEKRTLLVILACLFLVPSWGKHIIGGVMTYECLGNGLYAFTLKMYRDCSDPTAGGFDLAAPISVYKGASTVPEFTIFEAPVTDISLDPEINDPCLILPPNICVEEATYEFDITFDEWPSNEPYTISYQRCCRNVTITNVVDPGSIGATFTITLTPESQALCNSTPVFDNFPPIVICQGKEIDFLHSATDAEGDQLIYEFCAPLTGGGLAGAGLPGDPAGCEGIVPNPACPPPYEPVDYVPPYNPLNPLGGNPQVTIDAVTGLITGVPELLGQFVVGVCVNEFRNGQLLSTVRRDFQFNVASCEPVVFADIQEDSLLGDQYYRLQACAEENPVQIFNESTLNPFFDDFLWEFTFSDSTYQFTDLEPVIEFPGSGIYEGRFLINPGSTCGDTALVQVEIYPEVRADFDFTYDTCRSGPVFFTDRSSADPTPLSSWNWSFGDNTGPLEEVNPAHIYEEPGDFLVTLQVEDIYGCEDFINQEVGYFPAPAVILVAPDERAACPPAEISFRNLTMPVDESYEVYWEFGDGATDSVYAPSHIYEAPGQYSVYLRIVSPIGCETDTVFQDLIFMDELPVADFTYSPDYFSNLQPDITLIEGSERAVHWDWYINGVRSSTSRIWDYSFVDTGYQEISLVVTHQYGCLDTITKVVDVVPEIRYFLPNAFTPNEDGLNDLFGSTGIFLGIQDFSMQIWSRWGELIFETNDPQESWNGRIHNNGRWAPDGVYVCTVQFTEPRGEPYEYKGFVTILR